QATRAALALIASVPLAMLLAGPFRFFTAHRLLEFIAAAALGLGLLAWVLGRRGSPLWVIYLLTPAAIAGDILLGGHSLALALLSDFPVTGIRFYGIGAEYMGVLLGMGLMLVPWAAALRGRERLEGPGWALAWVVWLAIIFLLGWPGLGAKFGGALTALVGVLATARLCAGRRLRAR